MDMKDYTVCEAPVCVGSPSQGSEQAYRALREDLAQVLGARAQFCDFTEPREQGDVLFDWRLQNVGTVMQVSRGVYRMVSAAHEAGRFPMVIGGDHSVAMASIAALADRVGAENVAVVYIDGHADIHTEKTTESGYIHGMPLAAAMGLCCDKLTVGQHKIHLYGDNIYILGARSIDAGEWPTIEEQGVTLIPPEQVTDDPDGIVDAIVQRTQGKYIHLSFDVDVMDGKAFPSTGYRMPNGLTFDTAYRLLSRWIGSGRLSSFDCVEYNPLLDNGEDKEKLLKIFQRFCV